MSNIDVSDLEYGFSHTMGFVKLERATLRNPLLRRPKYLAVWIFLLTKALHGKTKDGDIPFNQMPTVMFRGRRRHLRPGQLATGSIQLAGFYDGMSSSSVRKILDTFEREGMINKITDHHVTIITILEANPSINFEEDLPEVNTEPTPELEQDEFGSAVDEVQATINKNEENEESGLTVNTDENEYYNEENAEELVQEIFKQSD